MSVAGFLSRLVWRFLLALVVVYAVLVFSLRGDDPQLYAWHEVELEQEYHQTLRSVTSFPEYLELENSLFRELIETVYDDTPTGESFRLWRYSKGSAADPFQQAVNWNRSFELEVDSPRGSVLLLHGMSDSPYSLRQLGQSLQGSGYRVLGLRLPGHGTAPSGLTSVSWQDMSAAVELAMRHLQEQLPGQPPGRCHWCRCRCEMGH